MLIYSMHNWVAMLRAVAWYCHTPDVYYGGELNHAVLFKHVEMEYRSLVFVY